MPSKRHVNSISVGGDECESTVNVIKLLQNYLNTSTDINKLFHVKDKEISYMLNEILYKAFYIQTFIQRYIHYLILTITEIKYALHAGLNHIKIANNDIASMLHTDITNLNSIQRL
jgi:hypothetical protein